MCNINLFFCLFDCSLKPSRACVCVCYELINELISSRIALFVFPVDEEQRSCCSLSQHVTRWRCRLIQDTGEGIRDSFGISVFSLLCSCPGEEEQ